MTASAKTDIATDTFLIGLGVSSGIAIGEAHLLNRAPMAAIERTIDRQQVEVEIEAFRQAVALSRDQLEEVKRRVADKNPAEHLYIIDTHLLILEDQMLLQGTEELIRGRLINAEGALKSTLEKFRAVFAGIEDEYLRDRRSDIEAIVERILRNLMGEALQPLPGGDRKVVVIAHNLSPADTMQLDRRGVMAFVTDVGGRTSHTAILARSLGIPAVVGLETVTSLIPGGTPIIVDGESGTLVLNPSPETFREYLKKKQDFEYREQELRSFCALAPETADGHRMVLRCNLELVEEVELTLAQGGEGIGLFRSEFLFLGKSQPPDEELQYQIYRQVVEQMAGQEVTIRTLDVGGDKFAPEINLADEANPALGLRAVRFSLAEQELFRVQLRAILRAAAHGKVRLMVPMVSGVAEVRACRRLLDETIAELAASGVEHDPQLPLGIMIETPSAVLIADLLAREVDFFSVGTNDLIQYCLAVDRANEHVAYLYEPLHPAVLRALQAISTAARTAGIRLSMCGEMAAEPLYLPILLALGFDELSMNPPCIPRVKQVLRKVSCVQSGQLLQELLQFSTATEVARHLENSMGRMFPELFGRPVI